MNFRAYLESEIQKRFEEMAYISRKEQPDAFAQFKKVDTVPATAYMDGNKYVIYSYKTKIAEVDKEKKIVFFNSEKYSATTTKLQNRIKAAFDGYTFKPLKNES